MIDNRGNKKEKAQEKSFPKVHVNCEKPIYRNIDSNNWKYWFFDVEIFTCLNNNYKIKEGINCNWKYRNNRIV